MPGSAKFSMTLQTEILSTETSDFLKVIIFLKSFNSELRYAKIGGLTIIITVIALIPYFFGYKTEFFFLPKQSQKSRSVL